MAEAAYDRGNALEHKGDADGAMKDHNYAIRLKQDYATAFNNRGIARRTRGDVEAGQRDCKEAVRLGYQPAN